MRSMAPSRPRLAGQIEEIRRDQRKNKARKSPQSRRSPERARQEQKQIWDLHGIVRLAVDLGHGDREGVAVSEQLVAETVRLEEHDERFDADDGAERFTCYLRRLHDARVFVYLRDFAADHGCAAVDGVGDYAGRGRERHILREGES